MTFRGWQVLVVGLVAAVVSAGTAMAYANRVARDSERRWCGIVVAQDDAYRELPPSTPAGQNVADALARLRADFGCPPAR
ncbi:hypothetical protein O7602_26640 [Micromonospora sp. WMMD1128]|uniref:hypothetical protein n=1 Tax=Micromonospora sp. WMMD1128 TaxID=3015150 RepID=UPI00248AA445|nr:hypothetical protein [Micromonospora sp. WMMD1128]WBB73222.1 hypothetical protein O7602_26640 [Micromonospora sp. WMMD1128]